MKIHFAVAVGILLTIGTAVSATLKSDEPAQARNEQISATHTASSDVLAMLEARASTSGFTPVARPL